MQIEINHKLIVDLRNLLGVLIASFTVTEWLLYWCSHGLYNLWVWFYDWLPWNLREVIIVEVFILFIILQSVFILEVVSKWSKKFREKMRTLHEEE